MGTLGDCWDRYIVRIREMEQSVKILRQAIAQMPDGEHKGKVPRVYRPPAGEVYLEIENPRGQLGFYLVSEGKDMPYRSKARGPSFCNLSVLNAICKGCLLADVPAIVGSIDVVMGEVDR